MRKTFMVGFGTICFCGAAWGCGNVNNVTKHADKNPSSLVGPKGVNPRETGLVVQKPTNPVPPSTSPNVPHDVRVLGMRKFPFPYRAMLAISSDADHETLRKFNLIHQFINTTKTTPIGEGLGLDISDSVFLYNGSNLFKPIDYPNVPLEDLLSYFANTTPRRKDANIIDRYIHGGWVDTLHSYGDFSRLDQSTTLFRRSLANQGLSALSSTGDRLTVWTDHGNRSNVDNFGSYGVRRFYDYQQGANPGSIYYHTDLLIPYGVKFVWADQNSDVFGHDSMVYPLHLPDGRNVWGFYRYTNVSGEHTKTVEWVWSVDSLARQLTPANMESLIQNGQYAIIAQHLCSDNEDNPLPSSAIMALQWLQQAQHNALILVARTSRLLQYNVTQQYLRYNVTKEDGRAVIHINAIDDPVLGTHKPSTAELRGVTFYTTDPSNTDLRIGNVPVPLSLVQTNKTDGKYPSIMVKWFAPDTTDYSIMEKQPISMVQVQRAAQLPIETPVKG